MDLNEYFKKHNSNIEEFCRKTGISRSAIYLYKTGRMRPSVDVALRIQEATNGEVTFDDLRYKICDLCKGRLNGQK